MHSGIIIEEAASGILGLSLLCLTPELLSGFELAQILLLSLVVSVLDRVDALLGSVSRYSVTYSEIDVDAPGSTEYTC